MQKDFKRIIVDTSCFILLNRIGELDLIRRVFKTEIITTEIVSNEYIKSLPDWVQIKRPANNRLFTFLNSEVDAGEASVIALALEERDCILILDDLKARKLADKLQLDYSGTLGLILKAKQSGIIETIVPIMNKIQTTNFRFSEEVFRQILALAGE